MYKLDIVPAMRHLWRHNSKEYRAEYNAWCDARNRCTNPDNPGYRYYGARGIEMCLRWINDFDAFMDDMGRKPKGMSLERQDVNGHYDPFNCIWASTYTQARNTTRNRWITYAGKTMVVGDWAKEIGHKPTVILHRLDRGEPIDRVLHRGSLVEPPKHGTLSMYMSKKCRCDLCRQANTEYARENRHRFKSSSPEYRRQKYQERKNAAGQ